MDTKVERIASNWGLHLSITMFSTDIFFFLFIHFQTFSSFFSSFLHFSFPLFPQHILITLCPSTLRGCISSPQRNHFVSPYYIPSLSIEFQIFWLFINVVQLRILSCIIVYTCSLLEPCKFKGLNYFLCLRILLNELIWILNGI